MSHIQSVNLTRFSHLAEVYEANRPHPPRVIVDILTQLAEMSQPDLVVDLASGTGLSTFIWTGRAQAVIGIEPNAAMRHMAESHLDVTQTLRPIRFLAATAQETGLPDGCADIITCAQALHWLEPITTFAEVARLLRPGGIFAAYDYMGDPVINWQVELVLQTFWQGIEAKKDSWWPVGLQKWTKDEHLARLQACGRFRYVRQMTLYQQEMTNTARFMGYIYSLSNVGALLEQGFSEAELGLDVLRTEVQEILGERQVPWYFSYTMWLGVK